MATGQAAPSTHRVGWETSLKGGDACGVKGDVTVFALCLHPPLETTYVTMQEDSWPLQPAPVK